MIVRLLLPALSALMLAGCVLTTTEVVRTHPDALGDRPATATGTSAAIAEHVVAPGETLYAIAFRRGLDWRSLASWNALQAPYTIYPGQRLKLGAGRTAATSVASTPAPASSRAGEGRTHAPASAGQGSGDRTAASGSGVAATTGVTPPAQRPAVSTPADTIVAVDATASTPAQPAPPTAGPQTAPPANTAPAPAPAPSSQSASPAIASTPPPTQARTPAAEPTQPPTALPAPDPSAPTASVGGIRWRWPTHGEVIQRFTGSDLTRQGINIAGRSGQAVVAAANGEVVYSGSGLRGYGELIIIKHSADYLSAYGHNRKRLVAEGQRVTAGQPIAELGRTGTDRDKLHFEIRHSGKPVDPLKYLPRR